MLCAVLNLISLIFLSNCASQYVTEDILICGLSRYRYRMGCGERGTADIQTEHFPYTVHSSLCATLTSVITNISILAVFTITFYFIHSYVMNRNDFCTMTVVNLTYFRLICFSF